MASPRVSDHTAAVPPPEAERPPLSAGWREAIDELKRTRRIADVVGSYGIALEPAGRRLIGL